MTQKNGGSSHHGQSDYRPSTKGLRSDETPVKKLELVLKCDSFGSGEAVVAAIERIQVPGVKISVIHQGLGAVSKSDLMMALTGSRLVVGFSVGIMPRLEQWIKQHEVEVRLYEVIYKLAEDLGTLAAGLHIPESEERITARARVIALFKSSPGGIILGCRVEEGNLSIGKNFRIIGAAGIIYTGRIESLHIREAAVNEAKTNQEVGLKVRDFKEAKVGDFLECFERVSQRKTPPWRPRGTVLEIRS